MMSRSYKLVLFFIFIFTQVSAGAFTKNPKNYYGTEFYDYTLVSAHDEELKMALKKILKSGHIRQSDKADQLVESCSGVKNCFEQTSLGYDGARRFLFGNFYLVKLNDGQFGVHEKYCDRIYQKEDFKSGNLPGPDVIPEGTVINIEHTWPQSKFSGRYPKDLQKADMHHLFPTDSKMNSLRGNSPFGEVQQDSGSAKCSASRFGSSLESNVKVFEPPRDHRGHVARALFYFSMRYDMPIKPSEESILKKWNKDQPVDAEELARNEEIYKLQGNRNPFIDHPELADNISDF